MASAKQLPPVLGIKDILRAAKLGSFLDPSALYPAKTSSAQQERVQIARCWLKAIPVQCYATAGFRPNETGTVPSSLRLGRA